MDNFMDKLAERHNAQDMIRANSQAETTQIRNLEDQVEAYEAVLQEMRKLNYKNTELTEKMYALVDESIEKVHSLQLEVSEGKVDADTISREMSDAVSRAVNEAVGSSLVDSASERQRILDSLFAIQQTQTNTEDSLSALASALNEVQEQAANAALNKETDPAVMEALGKVVSSIDELRQPSAFDDLTRETISAMARSGAQTQDTLTEMRGTVDSLRGSVDNVKTAMDIMRDSVAKSESGVEELHRQQTALAKQQVVLSQQSSAAVEEVRNIVGEINASGADILSLLRILKTGTDETQTMVKSDLETAMLGLKQDNKQLSESLNRLNTAITNIYKKNDPEKEEAEEQAKEEARFRTWEDRIKLTEDFMHKESVKVYRNVQAVVNDKDEKNREMIERKADNLEGKMNSLKGLVLVNVVVGLVNVTLMILRIFGIL